MYFQKLRWITDFYKLNLLSYVCIVQWGGTAQMCLETKHVKACNIFFLGGLSP